MRIKIFGRSGLRVSEFALGTMSFGTAWGWGAPPEECRRMFDAYAAAGGNFIDTANNYTEGESERIVGELIAPDRDHFVLATKYTMSTRTEDPNAGGNHRKNLVRSLEGSLTRLNTTYVDLLWVHAWDSMTPVEETMRALDDVVRAGKVLYVGISDAPAWWTAQANTLASLSGWSPLIGIQIQYSLIERTPERELLPMAQALDLGVAAWSPLGAGVLTGKYRTGLVPGSRLDGPWGAAFLTERNLAIAATVEKIATATGRSAAQVALAWLRQRSGNVLVPVLGTSKLAQLEDLLAATTVTLDAADLAELETASAIPLGFPHDFLNLPRIRQFVHSDRLPAIDHHRRGRTGDGV